MGCALARAVLAAGHEPVIVSGPVEAQYPSEVQVIRVVSTDQMRDACLKVFPTCEGLIAAAAPCDYRPVAVASGKLPKDGRPLVVEFVETPDVVASLAEKKESRWIVAFAMETGDHHARALEKLRRKQCNLIVVNDPTAIDSPNTNLDVLDDQGRVVASLAGDKNGVAEQLFAVIGERLIARDQEQQHGDTCR